MIQEDTYDKFIDRLSEHPTVEYFDILVKSYLYETDRVDFKSDYIEYSKLAKHMMALANTNGGLIIIGVKELDNQEFLLSGVTSVKDSADFGNCIKKYIPKKLKYKHTCLTHGENALKFVLISVLSRHSDIPYISEYDGSYVKSGDVYIRRDTESIKALNHDVDDMYKRKSAAMNLTTNSKDFSESIKKLKILYGSINKTKRINTIGIAIANVFTEEEENENYPSESFDQFIVKCIEIQKVNIESSLK